MPTIIAFPSDRLAALAPAARAEAAPGRPMARWVIDPVSLRPVMRWTLPEAVAAELDAAAA